MTASNVATCRMVRTRKELDRLYATFEYSTVRVASGAAGFVHRSICILKTAPPLLRRGTARTFFRGYALRRPHPGVPCVKGLRLRRDGPGSFDRGGDGRVSNGSLAGEDTCSGSRCSCGGGQCDACLRVFVKHSPRELRHVAERVPAMATRCIESLADVILAGFEWPSFAQLRHESRGLVSSGVPR